MYLKVGSSAVAGKTLAECLKKPTVFKGVYIHRGMLNILFPLDGQYK